MEPPSHPSEAEFWRRLPELGTDQLTPELRKQLAAAWTEDALMEHASIASFNRFSLQILSVGAPAELVAGAQQAALDEVRHARICFALASAYAGEPRGPTALSLEGDVLGALDLASVAASTVDEGCIGETVAALEAEAARDASTAPAVRAALDVIAEEEGRHAELAWSFVRWAVGVGGASVHAAVERTFEDALGRVCDVAHLQSVFESELAHHGRLGPSARLSLRKRALSDVLRPAAAALLGQDGCGQT